MKVKANIRRQTLYCQHICDEFNRRSITTKDNGTYTAEITILSALHDLVGLTDCDKNGESRKEAVFQLALNILEDENFSVEDDLYLAVQVLKQGRIRNDD